MNRLLARELAQRRKSLEASQRSNRMAWNSGHKETRHKWQSIDAINEHFRVALIDLEAEIKRRDEEFTRSATTVVGESITEVYDDAELAVDQSRAFIKGSKQIAELRNWQQDAANEVYHKLYVLNYSAVLLVSGTGTGKTFIAGNIIARAIDDQQSLRHHCISPFPYVYMTAAPVVEQTSRDLEYRFGIDILGQSVVVTNYEKLLTNYSKRFLEKKIEIDLVTGQEKLYYVFNQILVPHFWDWDEMHKITRNDAQRTQIAQAVNDLPVEARPKQLFMSATPFARIKDCKTFALACNYRLSDGSILNDTNWDDFAKSVATDGDPAAYTEASMERFMALFAPYIVNVRAPHGKFKAKNRCRLIAFPSPEAKARVDRAWIIYQEKKARIGQDKDYGPFEEWVALGQFLKATEYEKGDVFEELMFNAVENGRAAVCAVRYKGTVEKIVRKLMMRGVKREEISLIWGGAANGGMKRLNEDELHKVIRKIASGQVVSRKVLKQVETQLLETEHEKTEIEMAGMMEMRLGSQNLDERQREIDRFQTGKSLYCIYTYSAGGTGLSLHHTNVDPRGRPVALRQRRTFASPVFNFREFIQGLGRAHRSIFSLSDTEQDILFFEDSYEEAVMVIVSQKMRCLKKVVPYREAWYDAIYDSRTKSRADVKQLIAAEQLDAPVVIDQEINEEGEDDEND